MRRTASTIYAIFCLLAYVAGCIVVFLSVWNSGVVRVLLCTLCLLAGIVLAPTAHELGHVWFAKMANMKVAYLKFFCFRWLRVGKRLHFSFVNPFTADETQVIPASGGNMQKRALSYAVGGLIVNGVLLAFFLVLAFAIPNAPYLWGLVPSFAYLFLLNAIPADYPNGPTDGLVCRGLLKGLPVQTVMVTAMEIQGRIFAGETYAKMNEKLYTEIPCLAEDEPLFAVALDLRYRYYLEVGDLEKASACINRLAGLQVYLSDRETERVAGELTYMHALLGDYERALATSEVCQGYLAQGGISEKRILSAYTYAFGDKEKALALRDIALQELENEWILGQAEWERILLLRIGQE